MIATAEDANIWPVEVGKPFPENIIKLMGDLRRVGRGQDYQRPRLTIDARADELTAALEQWGEARRNAQVRSGEADTERRSAEIFAEHQKVRVQIAATHARTFAGMMAKLALAAPDFADEDLTRCEGSSENILASVAVDFSALKPALAAV
jgi:hypothetical protein